MSYRYGSYEYIADKDYFNALTNFEIQNWDVACFYAQQSIEKYLKAVVKEKYSKENISELLHKHSLGALTRKIKDDTLNSFINDFAVITDYYYETRYPGDEFHDCTAEEARLGIQTALKVKNWFDNSHAE